MFWAGEDKVKNQGNARAKILSKPMEYEEVPLKASLS